MTETSALEHNTPVWPGGDRYQKCFPVVPWSLLPQGCLYPNHHQGGPPLGRMARDMPPSTECSCGSGKNAGVPSGQHTIQDAVTRRSGRPNSSFCSSMTGADPGAAGKQHSKACSGLGRLQTGGARGRGHQVPCSHSPAAGAHSTPQSSAPNQRRPHRPAPQDHGMGQMRGSSREHYEG